MNSKRNKLYSALALGIGLCVTGVAGADTLATSVVNLTNLKFTDDAGTTFIAATDLNILSADNTSASNTVNLNTEVETITGATVAAPGSIDLPVLFPGGTASVAADGTNDLCVGSPCSEPNNEFEASLRSSASGDPATNQAFADELLQGAAIDFPGITGGAQVATEATAQLISDGGASAASENGLLATYDFVFDGLATNFNVQFDAAAYLETYRSSNLAAPGGDVQASGSYEVSFKVEKLSDNDASGTGVIFQWSPDGIVGNIAEGTEINDDFILNTTAGVDEFSVSDTDFVGAALGTANTGFFRARSNVPLVAGERYRITAAEKTSVTVRQQTTNIPEPATLSLFGFGLVGFGISAIKRRKKKLGA